MKNNKTTRKTKRKTGGYGISDKRLDDTFIITNLKDILNNSRPLKYKFDIKKVKKWSVEMFDVFITNNDEESNEYNEDRESCVSFEIFSFETNQLSILINTIFKCGPIKNYGNFILDSFKEFAEKYGYYSVVIGSDGSTLDFFVNNNGVKTKVYIDLPQLSILTSGESWYNRMGFYSHSNKEEIQDNLYKIGKEIQDIDDSSRIIDFIDRKMQRYKGEREKYLPECYKIVNTYGKFRDLYDFILRLTNKTGTNSVQEVFEAITNMIKKNCNTVTKICSLDYETVKKMNCFVELMYALLDIKYKGTSLEYIIQKRGGRKRQTKKTRKRSMRKK